MSGPLPVRPGADGLSALGGRSATLGSRQISRARASQQPGRGLSGAIRGPTWEEPRRLMLGVIERRVGRADPAAGGISARPRPVRPPWRSPPATCPSAAPIGARRPPHPAPMPPQRRARPLPSAASDLRRTPVAEHVAGPDADGNLCRAAAHGQDDFGLRRAGRRDLPWPVVHRVLDAVGDRAVRVDGRVPPRPPGPHVVVTRRTGDRPAPGRSGRRRRWSFAARRSCRPRRGPGHRGARPIGVGQPWSARDGVGGAGRTPVVLAVAGTGTAARYPRSGRPDRSGRG